MRRVRFALAVLLAAAASAAFPGQSVAASHVYSTAWDAQKIDEFTVGPGGALSSIGSVDAGDSQPWYIAMTSNAKNLLLTTFSGHDLMSFDVAADGTLTQKDTAHGGQLPTGVKPTAIAVSPDDRNAYVANYNGALVGSVSIYDIAADGSVSVHATAEVAAGRGPYGVAVSPDGNSVYVANSGGSDDSISQFNRLADGSLTPKTPATVTASTSGSAPDYVVLTPDGKHLYSANYGNGDVGVFDVAANGTLTEKASGSPVAGDSFYQMAVSPDGKSLYGGGNFDGKVYEYDIAADGALTAKSTASVSAGTNLDGVWLSPDGASAYAANAGTYSPGGNTGYDIAQFNIDSAGLLAAKSPATVMTDGYPAGMMVAPDQPPIASFTDPSAGGLAESFDASGSTDPDSAIARYVWDFGDGTGSLDLGPKPTHTFPAPGVYTVRLTVFDEVGCSTGRVYTGQTAYCNGNPAATTTRTTVIGAVPPTATTGLASAIKTTSATLGGTVNPNGRATSWHFEYGATTAYGKSSPSQSAGSGTTAEAVSAAIGGLAAGHTYHYRVAASSSAGTAKGLDRTFTTKEAGNPFGLPSTKNCLDRRRFSFKFKPPPAGTHIVDVKLFINGKRKLHVKGKNIRRVTITKLPKKKFKVRIVQTQDKGDVVTSTRTYHGCKKSGPKTHVHHSH